VDWLIEQDLFGEALYAVAEHTELFKLYCWYICVYRTSDRDADICGVNPDRTCEHCLPCTKRDGRYYHPAAWSKPHLHITLDDI